MSRLHHQEATGPVDYVSLANFTEAGAGKAAGITVDVSWESVAEAGDLFSIRAARVCGGCWETFPDVCQCGAVWLCGECADASVATGAAVDVGWVLDAGKVKGGGCSSSTELVRIGCTFRAPVQLHFEPVALTLTFLAVRVLPPIAPAHTTDGSPIAASIEARTVAVHFQVHSATGSRALKEGYAEWVVTQSTRSSSPLARTSKLLQVFNE